MSTSVDKALDAAAAAGFLVLFPGFVVYHFAVVSGWIPAFAGGLFGVASAVLAAISLLHFGGRLQELGRNTPTLELAFIAYCVYLFVWSLAAAVTLSTRSYVMPALLESLATISIWLAIFFVGSRLKSPAGAGRIVLGTSLAVIVLLFVYAMRTRESLIGPFLTFAADSESGAEGSTYQGVGRSLLVTAIAVASICAPLWKQVLALSVAVVGLMALGSRAHLFSCVVVMFSLALLLSFRKKNRATGALMAFIAIPVLYFGSELLLGTRAGEIFNLGESTSWQARLVAHDRAAQVIEESPFLGSFGYHQVGSAGYAHNILSVWTEYGAVAFLIYAALMLYAVAISVTRVLSDTRCTPMWLAAFQFNLTAVILALASEPVFASVFPPLGWACAVSALREERRRSREAADLHRRALGLVNEVSWASDTGLS